MKVFNLRRAMRAALLLLLMSAGVTKVFADEPFTVGYYKYYILSEANRTVSIGYDVYNNTFPNNFMAELPRTVTYQNVTYTVTKISGAGFWYCPQLLAIKIPNTVTRIGEFAFRGCANLQTVIIPNSVEDIEQYAFADCPALQTANWPENSDCWKIIRGTFEGCTGLLHYTIPENVTSIDIEAFKDCTSLEEIVFPASMNAIATKAFENCSSLRKVYSYRMDAPPAIVAETFKGAFAEGAKIYVPNEALYKYQTEYWMYQYNYAWPACSNDITADMFEVIPADMFLTYTYFEDDARVEGAREGIAGDLVIPNTVRHNNEFLPVTAVASEAFANCTGITSVTFGEFMENLGPNAFEACSGITSVDMSACTNLTAIGGTVFEGCTSMTSVALPQTLVSIGGYAFYNTGLTSITLPEHVTNISSNAFCSCHSLNTIISFNPIPPTLGNLAFNGCDGITKIKVPYGSKTDYLAAPGWGSFNESVYEEMEPAFDFYYDDDHHIAVVMGYGGIIPSVLEIPATVTHNDVEYTVTAINASAFKNQTGVSQFILPNTITSIGKDAFRGCRYADINIPENLTSLGEGAFVDCDHITSVTLPEGLTSIPPLAFYSCSSLTELHLPSTLTSIGIRAFANCNDLATIYTYATTPPTCAHGNGDDSFLGLDGTTNLYVPFGCYSVYAADAEWNRFSINQGGFTYTLDEVNHTATITGVTEYTFGDLVVPATMNSYPTTTITANAFSKEGITSISIPASATSINARAFANCVDLTAIIVADENTSFSSIDGVLFNKAGTTLVAYPCGKTNTSYDIPYDVTSICEYAFLGNQNLTSINLPAALNLGSHYACFIFAGFKQLEAVTVDGGSTRYKAIDGVLFSYDEANLLYYPVAKSGAYTVPANVNTIQWAAFQHCKALNDITINSNVTGIEGMAFYDCTALPSVTLPNTITTINESTFAHCSGLRSVNFLGNVTVIESSAFSQTGLVAITLPATVTNIDGAFVNCNDLGEITCQAENVPTTTSNAFFGVPEDIPVYVPAGSVSAYQNATGWSQFTIQAITDPAYNLVYSYDDNTMTATVEKDDSYTGFTGALVIPGTVQHDNKTYTVTAIADSAFKSCVGLTSAVIPHTMITIGNNAFGECTGLTALTIGRNVKTIGSRAFYNCYNLTEVHYYPLNCEFVAADTWYIILDLQYVANKILDIKNCVQTIPDRCFYGLCGLRNTTVTIPNSVTSIGNWAFRYCDMKGVNIGSGVTTIGEFAFDDTNLTSVVLPSNVTSVGDGIFYDCKSLTSATVWGVEEIPYYMFKGCTALTSFDVKSSVRTIGKKAFMGCSNLTTLTTAGYAGNLTTIGEEAFRDCGLTSIDIPSTVTTVETRAFYGNTNLTTVTIGTGMDYMGFNAFYDCTSLATVNYNATHCHTIASSFGRTGNSTKTLHIGNNVNYIPVNAFAGLKLTSVTIPNEVTVIGEYAFYDCENITEINIPNSVTIIGEAAFAGNKLATITLGSGLTSIGDYAFGTDESEPYLQTVTSYNVTPPTIFEYTFNAGDYTNATLYVLGDAAVTAYNAAAYWGNFMNIQSIGGYYFTGATNSNWGTASNWSTGEVPTTDCLNTWNPDPSTVNVIITTDATVNIENAFAFNFTIMDGNVVTVTNGNKLRIGCDAGYSQYGSFTASDASALVIEEGGQLWNNVDVEATVEKNITHYSDSRNGYNFIASPIGEFYSYEVDWLNPTNVEGMIEGIYDLYRFEQAAFNAEWQNYKANPFVLRNGWGYLYANASDVTLEFAGTVKSNKDGAEVSMVCTTESIGIPMDPENPEAGYNYENYPFAGWNLMGNPFACEAYVSGTSHDSYNYYKMNDAGSGLEAVESTDIHNAIPACTGIFVKTDQISGMLSFVREPDPSWMSAPNNGSLQIALEQVAMRGASEQIDNAIVSFNEGSKLEKFVLFQDNARIYIPQNGKDYAIVSAEPCGEMPINFVAPTSGQFTISVRPEAVPMSYLHLIDNLTGADTDLLQTSSYSFESNTTDYESRFKLVFICGNVNDDNETFAFFNNGSLIVANEGQATLQVMDMTGRILRSERINGTVNVNINEAVGVYVLRLINDNNVKSQKIIIK